MKLFIFEKLEGKELTDDKIRDFTRLVITQVAILLSIFLLEVSETYRLPNHPKVAELLFFLVLGVYVLLLWDALRNYTTNKTIIIGNFIFIMGVFGMATIVVNPIYEFVDKSAPFYKFTLLFTQLSLLTVEGFVIYFTLKEFFKKDFNFTIKLWAVACIYLMTGLAFGSLFEVFCIMDVNCLGTEFPLQTLALMKRMSYSMMILSGIGTPYPAPSGVVYMISTFEALWGQLFIVLIVGRLLIK